MKSMKCGPCGLFCGACGATDCDGCLSDNTDDWVNNVNSESRPGTEISISAVTAGTIHAKNFMIL